MSKTHDAFVAAEYGTRADAYVTSQVHAAGADLDRIEARVAELRPRRALDLGCGGGHVAYRLARHAERVVACDLTPDMLAAVERTAAERGLANIETRQGAAERLPFANGEFDLVASRYSAHHWRDFEAGLREARRVLRAGQPAIFVDCVSPGPALLDTHLQAVELLRDPTHVRNYSAAEWTAALARAGFRVEAMRPQRMRMEFTSWVARTRTPPAHQAAIRSLQTLAAAETRAHFEIAEDGGFFLDGLLMETIAV